MFFFFCKHNTAYEMRISDWGSDVCSSDLVEACRLPKPGAVAQYRSLTAQRRLGGPLRIRRPGDAGEHAVALLLHPARRPWHGDLDAVHAIAEVAVLAVGRMIGAELHVPLPTQLQTQSTAQRRLAAGRATAAHALLSGAAQAGRRCARALRTQRGQRQLATASRQRPTQLGYKIAATLGRRA